MTIDLYSEKRRSLEKLDVPFEFHERPVDVPADLRPGWRIGIVVLLLRLCCREGKARFRQLHVLNWGVRSRENQKVLEDAVNQKVAVDAILVRIEPSLNRAVDLAIAAGLVKRLAGDQVQLESEGAALADRIQHNGSLFKEEIAFMAVIKKKVNETFVRKLFN